jgi:cysteine-S-conjugate beta-lyase
VTSARCDFDVTDSELRAAGSVKWTWQPPEVLPAWVAELDVRPCPAVTAALREAIDRGAFGYPATDDVTGLPQATATFLARRFDRPVDPDTVLGCGDVMAGVRLALETLCERAAVVVPVPTYPPFLDVVPLTGRLAVPVHCIVDAAGRHALDLDAVAAALAAGARTVLLSQPHNPLGRVFDAAELAGLRDVVDRYGARVISDEIHAPLVLAGAVHTPYAGLPGTAGHTTTVVAASKAWNIPGLKCAQLVAGTPEEADRLRAVPHVANHGVSPLGIVATIAAYGDRSGWLDSLLDQLAARRELFGRLLAERLPQVRWIPNEATYLAWLDVRGTGVADPADAARRAGVAVSAGRDFGPGYQGFARLNLGTSAERLTRIMERLGRAWPCA